MLLLYYRLGISQDFLTLLFEARKQERHLPQHSISALLMGSGLAAAHKERLPKN